MYRAAHGAYTQLPAPISHPPASLSSPSLRLAGPPTPWKLQIRGPKSEAGRLKFAEDGSQLDQLRGTAEDGLRCLGKGQGPRKAEERRGVGGGVIGRAVSGGGYGGGRGGAGRGKRRRRRRKGWDSSSIHREDIAQRREGRSERIVL
eukprot:636981-Hanusia_phi.AAC.1